MKKLRVLVLMHEDLVPPESIAGLGEKEFQPFRTEWQVLQGLRGLGHEVRAIGVHDDLRPLREAIEAFRPHATFNLLEEFHGVSMYGQAVISFVELLCTPYTGSNPRGLMLSRDKVLAKKILAYHRLPIPRFGVFPVGAKARLPRRLGLPLLVKSTSESASLGISQASIVRSPEKLAERVAFMHGTFGTDVLAEEYIEGRELYLGVLGNSRLESFPVWEMRFGTWDPELPRIATARVKWDAEFQRRHGIATGPAQDLEPTALRTIVHATKLAYRALGISGYARADWRLSPDGRAYLLELNANPDLCSDEDFAQSAQAAGLAYEPLLQRILNLALSYRPAWKRAEE
ncbi:MAG: D-alanine--D-alanine ligase [Planctomycetes bacterium]|nr:D-alanine--D-alanine ligase [Planctomycetota bacterium]